MAEQVPLFFYGTSLQEADLLHLSGFPATDPFAFLCHQGRRTLFASDLELDRARSSSKADAVIRFSVIQKARQARGETRHDPLACAAEWLKEHGLMRLRVPSGFPLAAARGLEAEGFELLLPEGPLLPGRRRKDAAEVQAIRAVQAVVELALERGLALLAAATPGPDRVLMLAGEPLTSERVRAEIHKALVEQEASGSGTIVAGGEQACEPHRVGEGPLRAGETIILDIFPRSLRSFYHADLTRTVVRGRASERQRTLFEAVREAQEWALSRVRPGVPVREIHQGILARFAGRGFPTGLIEGRMQGFFHGTGHGVGLEIHEAPRVSDCDGVLEEGDVITIEPGLYYPGLGGVRLEDLVVVRGDGCENLTRAPKRLELP